MRLQWQLENQLFMLNLFKATCTLRSMARHRLFCLYCRLISKVFKYKTCSWIWRREEDVISAFLEINWAEEQWVLERALWLNPSQESLWKNMWKSNSFLLFSSIFLAAKNCLFIAFNHSYWKGSKVHSWTKVLTL